MDGRRSDVSLSKDQIAITHSEHTHTQTVTFLGNGSDKHTLTRITEKERQCIHYIVE